jgi:anti-sigma B factor antagonist
MQRFRVRATPLGDGCTLIISGEADLTAAPEVVELGTAALNEPDLHTLVIDLRDVTFMDSTCLGALIALQNTADKLGRNICLVAISPRVQRLIELTGLTETFAIRPDLEQTAADEPPNQPSGPDPLPRLA